MTQYLIVERWDEFQHYKNRAPLWIKNYTRLLHDDEYRSLSGHRRAILHGIWLEYASSSCQLHFDSKSLSARLNLRVTSADLQSLSDAGYIAVSASKPLANCYQDASLDLEKEKEKETPLPPSGKVKSCPECRLPTTALPQGTSLADHRWQSHGVEALERRTA